jgi:adenine phosphoribosyltransferase
MNHLAKRYESYDLDYIAGLDARGFIFGAILANKLGIGFVPIRKKGKLPFDTFSQKYELEYGTDEVEIHIDAFNNDKKPKVLLIDDLCATGGTAEASCKLLEKFDIDFIEACFILNLTALKGDEKIKNYTKVYSVLDI